MVLDGLGKFVISIPFTTDAKLNTQSSWTKQNVVSNARRNLKTWLNIYFSDFVCTSFKDVFL